ncbi:60S ribosomal export protein NMD3 [Acrasis kona]|uniref:60S ribosomal export protein NMD3 n=1 Tax=Acrasis kona TaxID=1008807 RepID=A0AAW2ZEJ9_9EUKA
MVQSVSVASSRSGHMVLCCLCGLSMPPNPANMCLNCIKSQVDITQSISKEEVIFFCRECERYLQPPKYWVSCDTESKELLTICLKRIHGLSKLKLVDAKFLYTEPHSRRLKVKITIQAEVFNGTVLQQSLVVDFVVRNQQCDACQKSYTHHTWSAVVQLRQKVNHKRTMMFLEQLILKHHMHDKCLNIKEVTDGIDFFFAARNQAMRFIDFIKTVAPIKSSTSERLITHDMKSNIHNYKYSFSIDIPPVCREDLICLPHKLCRDMGGIGPLVLCSKVNSKIYFIDPTTLQESEITKEVYWKHSFTSLMDTQRQVQYTVLDVEPIRQETQYMKNSKHKLVEAQVVRSDEMGNENDVVFIKTHLGRILKPGDNVMGYDVRNSSYNDHYVKEFKKIANMPDVILVRKIYEKRRGRKWKLRTLMKDPELANPKKNEKPSERVKDRERFMEELEEEKELRDQIDLIKLDEDASNHNGNDKDDDDRDDDSEQEEIAPGVQDEELRDEQDLVQKTNESDYDDGFQDDEVDEELEEAELEKRRNDKREALEKRREEEKDDTMIIVANKKK